MMYFFSGLGGAGTLPLAFILKGLGHEIAWSDRGRDLNQNPEKFAFLQKIWPRVYPQDGSGPRELASQIEALIPSGSVEPTVPDIAAATAVHLHIVKRPEMLAQLFNAAEQGIAIAGTSGKTTTTGMSGYLLHKLGRNPTVMNGGVFRNFKADNPWCCAMVGKSGLFVTEVDESDGSIALYRPQVAVLTNISLDHKSMEELRALFSAYLATAKCAVLNLDDAEVRSLASTYHGEAITFGLENEAARLNATSIRLRPSGSDCVVTDSKTGHSAKLSLMVLGRHNISNALAAIAAALAVGASLEESCAALAEFAGIERRLEVIGEKNGITVIDDFGHNPDKIAASLKALRAFEGRLLLMFQPHGFGPLRLMRHELVESFAAHLAAGDRLYIPEPFYAGGTVDRSVTSSHIVNDLIARGIPATVWPDRASITPALLTDAKPGDRIIVMGARDDTLGAYARGLLERL